MSEPPKEEMSIVCFGYDVFFRAPLWLRVTLFPDLCFLETRTHYVIFICAQSRNDLAQDG